jgi:phytoene desaturase (3,4-didehydrolycopene-forming)
MTNTDDSKTSSNLNYNTAASCYGLHLRQCIPAYQVVFDDGEAISLGFPFLRGNNNDPSLSIEEMKRIQILEQETISKLNNLETNGFEKWQDYLNTCAAFLDCGLPNFIEERLDVSTLPAFMVQALKEKAKRWPLQPHSTMLDSLFDSPKLKAMASFQDLYVGLEPYKNHRQFGGGVLRKSAPAIFGLLAALELHPTNDKAGVFAPVGGFRQVAESMYQLCLDNDVSFKFDTSVTRITDDGVYFTSATKHNNQEVEEKGFLQADLVICNADLPFATETILSASKSSSSGECFHEARYDWNARYDYSSGVIAFHWSFSRQIDALKTHNVFMSAKDSETAISSWSVLRDDDATSTKSLKDWPFNFYVHRASHTDKTAAPPGCDSIMVLVPCKALVRSADSASLPRGEAISKYKHQFDEDLINDVREAVFERLSVLKGLERLRDYVLDEVIDTPGTYADYYNLAAGVPFGLSHGLSQLSLTRPGAESNTHTNTLFVGASSRPGNGVPLVLIGARLVAEKALKQIQEE